MGIYQDQIKKSISKIMEISSSPTLERIVEKKGKLFLEKGMEVEGKKVQDYCYVEEEFFGPIVEKLNEKGLKWNENIVDTKILRFMHSDLDFNAYSLDPIGRGLNIDGMTRISGRLYKIKRGIFDGNPLN